MYHSISDEPEPGVPPYYRTTTSPAMFREQMQVLAALGYRTLTLTEALRAFGHWQAADAASSKAESTNRVAVITFDDGFRNFYTEAFPILRQHGFSATMFVSTGFIGDNPLAFRTTSTSNAVHECLTWAEIRELERNGIEFGSHTVTHPKLVELGWSEIESELRLSKAALEQHLQKPVDAFCYPYAFPQGNRRFVERFCPLLAAVGYTSCCTTELGRLQPHDDPFRIKRLPANASDDPALFRAKLEGAYDWLAAPQAAVKRVKSLLRAS